MGRRLGVLAVVAALVALAAPTAALAARPDHVTNHYSGSWVVDDLCPFPVTVDFDQVGSELDRYDAAGNWIGLEVTVHERDTYSAVHVLVSEPYTFHVSMRLDADGNLVMNAYSGLLTRFVLPDGTQFILAGRSVDPDPWSWIVWPDHGLTGDIDAFCAALGG